MSFSMCKLRPLPLCIFVFTLMTSAWSAPWSPAQQVYEDVSPLRNQHAAVIWGGKPATPEELQAILVDLDKGLDILAAPLNLALSEGDVYLRFRRYNFLNDKAKLQARLGDTTAALRSLDEMSRMAWLDPRPGFHPEGDPDLKPVLEGPRAATLRARYAMGPRFGNASALKTPYRARLSEAERLAGLSHIWSVARQGFVWFDHVPDLDWDKAYLDAIPRVMAARDTAAYYRELIRFTALLKDGHSNAYAPESLAPLFYSRPGLHTARIEGKVLVTEIADASLQSQGLRVGDVISSIDGLPVDAYVSRHVTPYQSSSTPQDLELRSYSYMLLAGDAKRPVRLGMQRADGSRYSVRAPRSGYSAAPGKAREAFELRSDGVAVLKASQFENDAAAKLMDANSEAILNAKALVIDMRGNGGGSSNLGWMLLSWLQQSPVPTPVSQVREDNPYQQASMGPSSAEMWQNLPSQPFEIEHDKHFDGPVAVLIDAATFSAADDTAAAFKLMKRGIILGMPSGGSTGQPFSFALPGGGTARICVKRDSYPDGTDFVGVGVQPDIKVERTVASVRDGSDPVLSRAVQALLTAKP
jgi:C-terminal processing protease CtpA/Prc